MLTTEDRRSSSIDRTTLKEADMSSFAPVLAETVRFPESAFVPLAVGFFGLATGYLIYGPEELFKLPTRSRPVDLTTGIWGIFMPGLMQLITGILLFVGLTWFNSFRSAPLYMAALAFTAYGVHWFALGLARVLGGDPRPNAFMSVSFIALSGARHHRLLQGPRRPVGGLFIGLTLVYISDFFASLFLRVPRASSMESTAPSAPTRRPEPTKLNERGERALGFFHIGTGLWLIYLTFAAVLNIASGMDLPL
jgi:hypothetical protein